MPSVSVSYKAIIKADNDHVVYNKALFNCSGCCHPGKGVCCTDLASSSVQCLMCSCQGKIASSVGNAFSNNCCYFKGVGSCVGSCKKQCGGKDCTVNEIAYEDTITTIPGVECTDALAWIADPTIKGQVINELEIKTGCNSTKQLQCCKGDPTLGALACGQFWGPTNKDGACDTLMSSYCDANPKDSSCICLKSELNPAECIDKRCKQTSSFKLSDQLNNECKGSYMTCNQYFNLAPGAQSNFIDKNTFAQNCKQTTTSTTTAPVSSSQAAENSKNSMTWILVAVGIVVGLAVVGGVIAVARSKSKQRQLS